MSLKGFVSKYGSSVMALALTAVATQIAARGCFFIMYQPKEPKGFKKFSKK